MSDIRLCDKLYTCRPLSTRLDSCKANFGNTLQYWCRNKHSLMLYLIYELPF